MKLWALILAIFLVASGCERNVPQRGAANEGKAAQSAAGGSADEGRAARSAGR